ncbi:hypothetical protein Clacol_004045 [Clathrus columnatus]|uniref:Cytosolic endo-beta-N-acetylglucosaminidase TIM barrel domain-containing protein n=1 Tax=Clathrus columnatus TaxID=1419009 RepID=A0AAV5A9Z0_9AGAM|nr:hypothetical protein Clacol_004045 [Clathrus columnatus]
MPVRALQRDRLSTITLDVNDAWILEVDYLKTIDGLLAWVPHQGSENNVPGIKSQPNTNSVSKLLVCHDFKGGYTENLFERGYSFEFWHLIDAFIYFSHNRVTTPPRGWIEAGHRRGVKVLGTLIFEWKESKPDLCKCLYQGNPYFPPNSKEPAFAIDSAIKLIQMAQDRIFDGYLLNIETDLNFLPPVEYYPGGEEERDKDEQAFMDEQKLAGLKMLLTPELRRSRVDRMTRNALAIEKWTAYIKEEGKRLVGPHFEVIWYDSVTTAGNLEWQDALTTLNAPFFMAAGNIFTNYTWASPIPTPPGGFPPCPVQHHPKLLQSARMAIHLNQSASQVYIGIDVFGRNCYGGFDISKSLDMIFPTSLPDLGLSVALFAQGWTWERAKDDGTERSWTEWWNDDLRLWLGPSKPNSDNVPVSGYFGPRKRSLTYTEISPFYTNFSRGSGKAWWMFGTKVYDAVAPDSDDHLERSGWTDVGASFPMPDRLWPQTRILDLPNEENKDCHLVDTTFDGSWIAKDIMLDESDVWQGSTCLKLTFTSKLILDNSLIPGFILPLCTLSDLNVTTPGKYSLTIMTKFPGITTDHPTILPQILWADDKSPVCSYALSDSSTLLSRNHIANGWYCIEVEALLTRPADTSFTTPVLGLQITSVNPDDTLNRRIYASFECLIGSIVLNPVDRTHKAVSSDACVATWKPLQLPGDGSLQTLWGVLSWDKEENYRGSGYFDIVVSVKTDLDHSTMRSTLEDEVLWLGSSTAEKKWNSFVVSGLDLQEIPNYNQTIKVGYVVNLMNYKRRLTCRR